ncbi:type IV secretion system protein VirB10 [Roseateles saccharophilus]|uniref:Type IV secretion system protein VirB10 n=1 Tax=Roseateles saccharophilus TaxID=304 RepID=A0A4R3UIK2_ROSSA|nr:type IV secretion system protein VirB10 [Roseateles saccharophilus]MDG0834861.1 type IV secretion system protein VirB10 [Roseateles saccharophilus]TCU88395.1 type IV secretion system protein VirB10 [Roseateles saccharophilus]
MNAEPRSGAGADGAADDSMLSPLPGEPGIPSVTAPSRVAVSRKGLLAVGLLVLSLVVVSALAIHRFATSTRKGADDDRMLRDKPAAAGTEPRRIEMPVAAASAASTVNSPRVPAILPTDDEQAEPIGVRRTGSQPPSGGGQAPTSPQDAPVLLVSTRPALASAAPRPTDAGQATMEQVSADAETQDPLSATSRNLQAYQRQLQGLLDNLTRTAELASAGGPQPGTPLVPPAGPLPAPMSSQQVSGLFGGQLQGSATPRVAAAMLGNRSLTLPKGTAFTCALKTRVISAASGMVGCQVQRNVYSDDGRVLLIERGSHLDGEYRIAAVRPGMVRIPVLWTRLRTPFGVTVDIESPATGQLGESGIDGDVDNRWTERIGAAMLLSLIDDSVKLVIQGQANDRQASTIVLPSTTANTSKLAEKVLDSTINIPPLIYRNQGGIVGIYVARDLDFSSVYELRPTPASSPKP